MAIDRSYGASANAPPKWPWRSNSWNRSVKCSPLFSSSEKYWSLRMSWTVLTRLPAWISWMASPDTDGSWRTIENNYRKVSRPNILWEAKDKSGKHSYKSIRFSTSWKYGTQVKIGGSKSSTSTPCDRTSGRLVDCRSNSPNRSSTAWTNLPAIRESNIGRGSCSFGSIAFWHWA